ncbi:hypothetical protein BGX34_004788, partial [Mortierella sp. NVP85]
EKMVEWDSWLPADEWGKWGLVETEENTMATQATPDVTLDEIEDDQLEEEDDTMAIPSTPADDIDIDIGIDIDEVTIDEIEGDQVEEEVEEGTSVDGTGTDNMTTDKIEEKEAKKVEEKKAGEEEVPTQAKDDDDDDDEYGIKPLIFSRADEMVLEDALFEMASEEDQELDHFRHAKFRKLLRDEKDAKYSSRKAARDLLTYEKNYDDALVRLDWATSALHEAVARVQVSADKAAAATERRIALAVELGILPAPSPAVNLGTLPAPSPMVVAKDTPDCVDEVTKPAESAEINVGMDQSSSGSRVWSWSALRSFMTKQK